MTAKFQETTMAAGVLPPNEQLCLTVVKASGYAANMKGNSEHPVLKYTEVGERLWHAMAETWHVPLRVVVQHASVRIQPAGVSRREQLMAFTCPGSLTISWPWYTHYLSSSRITTSWSSS